jgi:hypothetical protein
MRHRHTHYGHVRTADTIGREARYRLGSAECAGRLRRTFRMDCQDESEAGRPPTWLRVLLAPSYGLRGQPQVLARPQRLECTGAIAGGVIPPSWEEPKGVNLEWIRSGNEGEGVGRA